MTIASVGNTEGMWALPVGVHGNNHYGYAYDHRTMLFKETKTVIAIVWSREED